MKLCALIRRLSDFFDSEPSERAAASSAAERPVESAVVAAASLMVDVTSAAVSRPGHRSTRRWRQLDRGTDRQPYGVEISHGRLRFIDAFKWRDQLPGTESKSH